LKKDKEKKKPDYNKNIALMRLKDMLSDGLPTLVKWNFMFFVSCLPVVTIGPALAALYHCVNLLVRNELPQEKSGRLYINSFKSAFSKTIVSGLLIFLSNIMLYTGFYVYISMSSQNIIYIPMASLSLIGLIIIYSIICHFFPAVFTSAYFSTGISVVSDKTTKEMLQNALEDSFKNPKKTLLAAIISLIVYPAQLLFFPASIPLILTIGLIIPVVAAGFAHTEPEKEMYIIG